MGIRITHKPIQLDMRKLARRTNKIVLDKMYKGARKMTKAAKMQTGLNRGKENFYASWHSMKLSSTSGLVYNDSIPAGRFQRGYSTVAIQIVFNNLYVGWRTSSDPRGKKNSSLTRWVEKYIPNSNQVSKSGKPKTFHISVPFHKFKVKDHGISRLMEAYMPLIRKPILAELKRELKQNLLKYKK